MTEPNPDTAHEPQPGSPADAEEEAMADVELEEEEVSKVFPKTNKPTTHSTSVSLPEQESFSRRWSSSIDTVRILICRSLKVITHWSATHPWTTVVSITVLSLAMIMLGISTNFVVETDGDILWPPRGSVTQMRQRWIEDESNFSQERYFAQFYVHRKNGGNLLAPGHAQRSVQKLFELYNNMTSIEMDGNIPGYDEICAEPYTDPETNVTAVCDDFGAIEFWNLDSTLFQLQVTNDEEVIEQLSASQFPNGKQVHVPGIFGGPVYDNTTGLLTQVEAYRLTLVYPIREETIEFLGQVIDVALDLSDDVFQVEVFAYRSFDDEFQAAIVKDIPLMPMAFTVMSIFCCIVFGRWDKVRSQSLVGFGAVVTVLFSILTGYGLLFLCGIPMTSATQIVVFVMFGIGLDDAFIISGSYSRTDPRKDPVERIADTIDDIGLSIAITTLTSSIAFATGCISSISSVYWLCLYAFPTIIIDFIYQISMFVAILVIDERRMQRNKRDCLVCLTVKGREDENANSEPSMSPSSRFMDAYADILFKPGVKAAVLVFFAALFGACVWGTTQLRQELDFIELVPSDSYVIGFFEVQDLYFSNAGLGCAAYFRDVDQSDPAIRASMGDYINDLEAENAIITQPPYFWVRDFEKFVASGNATDTTIFNEQMDAFLADPLYNSLYGDNIVRDPETKDVLTSRVWVYMDIDLGDSRQLVDQLDLLRDIEAFQSVNEKMAEKDYSFFSFDSTMNMWEFYAIVPKELTFTTVTGVVAVCIIGLAFIPHWTAIFFLLPSIVTVYIDLLGFLYFVGVRINPVSFFTLVMSIGLLVDFITHPLMRYYECKTGSREDRVRETLVTMGSSILIGGISTFLGVMLLAFSTSTIFSTIFRAFIGLVLLGCSYGLMLLPVVLSLVGPEDGYEAPEAALENVPAMKKNVTVDVTAPTEFLGESSKYNSQPLGRTRQDDFPPLDEHPTLVQDWSKDVSI